MGFWGSGRRGTRLRGCPSVVAFVSGLAKVNDPWGDLVDWFREMTLVRTRYQLFREAVASLGK